MADEKLSPGELAVLIHGLSDQVDPLWALVELGIRSNPPKHDAPPSRDDLELAFASFRRLEEGGYAAIGKLVPVPGGKPDPGGVWPAPSMHAAECLDEVRRRVELACIGAEHDFHWEFACWLHNTAKGNLSARAALAEKGDARR